MSSWGMTRGELSTPSTISRIGSQGTSQLKINSAKTGNPASKHLAVTPKFPVSPTGGVHVEGATADGSKSNSNRLHAESMIYSKSTHRPWGLTATSILTSGLSKTAKRSILLAKRRVARKRCNQRLMALQPKSLGDRQTTSPPSNRLATTSPTTSPLRNRLATTSTTTAVVPVGGRIQLFRQNWISLTADHVVLDILRRGYKLPFESKRPGLIHQPPYQRLGTEKEKTWEPVVQRMLDMEAIEEVVDVISGGVYSHVFLRLKPNGSYRPIINLKPINKRLKSLSFSMATPRKVLEALAPGVWTTSVDLKDAYFHVPIAESHRKYLRFAILGKVFQFKTLPFGLAPAPRIFTQCVSVLLKWCHRNGIQMIPYLDDWLLYDLDRSQLVENTKRVVEMAGSLGWVINMEKSDLTPSQRFDFLGMTLDTRLSTVRPCDKGVKNMLSRAAALKSARQVNKKSLLQLQGTMVSLGDIVRMGKLRRRPFQAALCPHHIHGSPTQLVTVTPDLKRSVEWWSIRGHLTRPVSFLKNRESVTLVTDASMVGWGATVSDIPIRGVWTGSQTRLHINCLEMLAVEQTLRHTPVSLSGRHLQLHTDNMTVRSYLLKQGGTVSTILNRFTEMVWSRITKLNATLSVKHISGSLNVLADRLSRPGQVLAAEWELSQDTFQILSQVWMAPSIDLFATRYNAKLPLYVSPCPDNLAVYTDAMTLDWETLPQPMGLPYCFPPFRLILAVLEKIKLSRMACSL